VQKLLLDAKEAQTESAGYQTEPGTLSMTGKKQKKRKDRAFTRARAQVKAVNYRKLDKEVKKSCKQDKKDWIESKCTETQEAASRNETKHGEATQQGLEQSPSQNRRWCNNFKF